MDRGSQKQVMFRCRIFSLTTTIILETRAGAIAHDFCNLLTGITGAMDIMKRRIAAGRVRDVTTFKDAPSAAAHRAAPLTHRLLAFARHQPLDPGPVDVSELILGVEDL